MRAHNKYILLTYTSTPRQKSKLQDFTFWVVMKFYLCLVLLTDIFLNIYLKGQSLKYIKTVYSNKHLRNRTNLISSYV